MSCSAESERSPGRRRRASEQGIALLLVVFVLMMMSAVGIAMLYMTDTETALAADYRDSQQAYFAARAGLQEGLARLAAKEAVITPTAVNKLVYIINKQQSSEDIKPWDPANKYFDTELCHENLFSGISASSTLAPCTAAPSGSSWYSTQASTGPNTNTSAALSYKWVRINLKVNASAPYSVSSTAASSQQVFWNNGSESTGGGGAVYVITALAMTPRGSRRMVQAEVAATPSSSFPYTLVATGTGCGAIKMSGGVKTDSYDSSAVNGVTGTYNNTHQNSGADVATNGNIDLSGSATVNGSIYAPNTTRGDCRSGAGITSSGGASCNPWASSCSAVALTTPIVADVEPIPALTHGADLRKGHNNSGPWGPYTPGDIGATSANSAPSLDMSSDSKLTLSGGTYYLYDLSVSGAAVLTLGSGTYYLNSFTLTGGGRLQIAAGASVVFNIADNGQKSPLDLSGGTIANDTLVASNFKVNYAGSGDIKISGGASTYMALLAPNADVKLSGGTDFYGAIVAKTIDDSGGANFHYDKALKDSGGSGGGMQIVSSHEVMF